MHGALAWTIGRGLARSLVGYLSADFHLLEAIASGHSRRRKCRQIHTERHDYRQQCGQRPPPGLCMHARNACATKDIRERTFTHGSPQIGCRLTRCSILRQYRLAIKHDLRKKICGTPKTWTFRATALNFAHHEAISMLSFSSGSRIGTCGGRRSARLLAVVHALHAHEHHRQTWQKKE